LAETLRPDLEWRRTLFEAQLAAEPSGDEHEELERRAAPILMLHCIRATCAALDEAGA